MRRRSGLAVIGAAAVLGVVAAVAAGAHGGLIGGGTGVGGGTGTVTGSGPGGSSPATTPHPSGTPTTPSPTGIPSTSSATGTSPPTTPSTTSSTSADTPAELSGVALSDANLVRLDDFARAGWSTATLTVATRAGDGAGIAGTCQAQPLSSLPGGGGARSGSYLGRVTRAYETAATFTTQQQALAAYATVVEWFHQCASGTLPGHLGRRATVGPDMQVNLDTEFDRALWVRISGDGFDGTGGVALAGRRVAVFFDEDAEPAPATVGRLMTAVALRLTA